MFGDGSNVDVEGASWAFEIDLTGMSRPPTPILCLNS